MPARPATVHILYRGAVYKQALQVQDRKVKPEDFRRRFDAPAGEGEADQKKKEEQQKAREKAQKFKQRYDEPSAEDKQRQDEGKKRTEEFLRKREETEPEGGPVELTPEMRKKEPVNIALNFSKIAPIWYALFDYAEQMEKKLNQDTKTAYEEHAKAMLRWFTTIAAKSSHADVRAIAKLLANTPSAYNLFRFNPPVFKEMRRYFDKDRKESESAVGQFIRRINQVAQDQGWNIHS